MFYIALTSTCVNKDFWKNHVVFEMSLKVNRWAEVSKYELASNLGIWDSDKDFDIDDIIWDVGNDF